MAMIKAKTSWIITFIATCTNKNSEWWLH